ncbi:hypothetical protein ACPWSR_17170 [Alloiococcus sp. CFN-8]|uniref:hypothetical protein n=1 Tax=Alloiococcus sp. CFN-8 TaxID=3416081 RepID=UPI003CF2B619
MGIKRYKGYNIKRETNHDFLNKINRHLNYIILLLILANLYFLPKYLGAATKADVTIEELPVIVNSITEEDKEGESRAYKVTFISKGLDVISNGYIDNLVDFQLSQDQLNFTLSDEEGKFLQQIDKITEPTVFFEIMDIEVHEDSNIRIRMVRSDE